MQQALNLIRSSLKDVYPHGEIEGFIRLIFDHLCGYSTTDLLLKRDEKLLPELRQEVESIVERLKLHEPIQYILECAYFGDLQVAVGKGVLIPRPETAEMVARIIDEQGDVRGRVADFCTGSGCIAVALARAWAEASVEGWDVSQEALAYARRNAEDNGVRVAWRECDLLSYEPCAEPRFDIIVSNPPYVLDSERAEMDDNVLHFEPHLALFVPDDDPLLFYEKIADVAWRELVQGGILYFEINSRMGDACREMLCRKGFVAVEIYPDFMGADRVVKAVKPQSRMN